MSMTIVTGLVGSGKTVEMVKQCADRGLTIVVEREEWKRAVYDIAKTLKANVEVITFREFTERSDTRCCCRVHRTGYFIDRIDRFMAYLVGGDLVRGFTCDGEGIVVTAKKDGVGFYKKDIYSL